MIMPAQPGLGYVYAFMCMVCAWPQVHGSLPAGPAFSIPGAGTCPPPPPPRSPGPGEYHLPASLPAGPAYSIPATGRGQAVAAGGDGPGPGEYEVGVRVGEAAPAFTMPGRHPESPRPSSLGPGESP